MILTWLLAIFLTVVHPLLSSQGSSSKIPTIQPFPKYIGYYCNIDSCITCSAYNYCAKCQYGYLWSFTELGQTQCILVQCNIDKCQYCYSVNSCQKCSEGYYISDNGICIRGESQMFCLENCLNCTKSNTCNLCSYGFNLQNNQCVSNAPFILYDGCLAAFNTKLCQVCKDQYYLMKSGLYQLSNYCLKHINAIVCNISNCYSCKKNSTCSICLPGYGLVNQTCIKEYCDDKNCISCQGNPSICQLCWDGYKNKYGKCLISRFPEQIEHCTQYQSRYFCQNCSEGYTYSEKNLYGKQKAYIVSCQKQSRSLFSQYQIANCRYLGKSRFQRSYKGIECIQCQNNYVRYNSLCLANITYSEQSCNIKNCKNCIFPNFCSQCNDGFAIDQKGKCWKMRSVLPNCISEHAGLRLCQQCELGFHMIIDDIYNGHILGICVNDSEIFQCPHGCKTCFQNNECQDCIEGYQANGTQCLPKCNIDNCYQCQDQNTCRYCDKDFYPNRQFTECTKTHQILQGQCTQSAYNCAKCNIYQQCILCQQGYIFQRYFNFGYCLQKIVHNITGCLKYYSQTYLYCIQCEPGYYMVGGMCYTLHCEIQNCQYCLRSNQCLICSYGYNLNQQSQCQPYQISKSCNQSNCITCDKNGSCIQCLKGYILYQGQCQCPFQNCDQCLADIVCVKCYPGFIPALSQNGGCVPDIIYETLCEVDNCAQCYVMNKCSFCNIGYELNSNGTCSKTKCQQQSCELCFGQQQFCYLCKNGFTPVNILSQKCLPTMKDYSCPINNCAYCSSPYSCLVCYDTFKLIDDRTCQKISCPEKCVYCLYENKCVVCEKEYQVSKNGTCQYFKMYQPWTGINQCSEIDKCLYCEKGYYGTTCTVCIPGFQPNQQKNQCIEQKCVIDHCQICIPYATSPNLQSSLCMICQIGYFLNSYLKCVAYNDTFQFNKCNVSHCIACSDDNYCTSCIPGWSPVFGRCYDYIYDECQHVDGCQICMSNQNIVNNCFSCRQGYQLTQELECLRPEQKSNSFSYIFGFLAIICSAYIVYCKCFMKNSAREQDTQNLKPQKTSVKDKTIFQNQSVRQEIL